MNASHEVDVTSDQVLDLHLLMRRAFPWRRPFPCCFRWGQRPLAMNPSLRTKTSK